MTRTVTITGADDAVKESVAFLRANTTFERVSDPEHVSPPPDFCGRYLLLLQRRGNRWFRSRLRDRTPDRDRIEVKEARAARAVRLFSFWWFGTRPSTLDRLAKATADLAAVTAMPVVVAQPTERRVLTPTFDCETPLGGELPDACLAVVNAIRFDATALPVESLAFEVLHDGVLLDVALNVPDRDTPGVLWMTVYRSVLCPWRVIRTNGAEYLVWFMRETIANVLAHEVSESVTFDGVRVFDPHRTFRIGGS